MEGFFMKKALFAVSLFVTFNVAYGMDGGDEGSSSWVEVGGQTESFKPRAEALVKHGPDTRLFYQDEQGKLNVQTTGLCLWQLLDENIVRKK
jgi:hypothetical protein